MSKNALIVLSVLEHQKSVSAVAKEFQVSRAWVYELLRRYRLMGVLAFEPASKAHHNDPNALSDQIHTEIKQLREELTAAGLDAGADSIRFRLMDKYGDAPSLSSIWRSLRKQGLVEYSPHKRPKLYLQRFEADQPNQTWQSDFTHVRLAGGQDILVLNFLDDHSRFLLSCTAHHRISSNTVVERFSAATSQFGVPQSSLTDNGLAFTSRLQRGKNAYEHFLAYLGVEQKNSRPNHPQTQGKIERFHQTLKKWLAARPKAKSIKELQVLLDQFRDIYNNQRPHRALAGKTPSAAYRARPKAQANPDSIFAPSRARQDRVDKTGKVSIRLSGRMHHLGVGRAHKTQQVFIIIDSRNIIVTHLRTGEILGEYKIEPTKSYWPKKKSPDKSPGS